MVARQLLSAHKIYIDELMENLRLEMNVIRDFEAIITKNNTKNNNNNGEEPALNEEEILKYFETVYAYLDRSSENGMKLRKEMDRVSRS